MGVPKRRSSRSRKGMRRGSDAHKRPLRTAVRCPQCGAMRLPHRVCAACGSYDGRQVLTVRSDD